MNTKPLGFAADAHATSETRHGWSKALQLPPDLYPGVGGKRFRAELVEQAYRFAGGRGRAPREVIDAVELLHAGSLVIDDFEDGSQTRRGQPALHRVVGAPRAINAGNWMYFRALEIAGGAYRSPARGAELLARFVQVARQCHEGQAIDLSTRVDAIAGAQAWPTALAISRWKTGRLVSLAAWSGAHAAGADSATLRAVSAFGCRIGVCLQMRNDLEELARYAAGGVRSDDLRNRRVTWPWAWASRDLTGDRFVELQSKLRRAAGPAATRAETDQPLRAVARDLLTATAGSGATRINDRLRRAASLLRSTHPGDGAGGHFSRLVERLRLPQRIPVCSVATESPERSSGSVAGAPR